MALKPCRECGEEVSTDAKTCPHCGVRYPGKPLGASPGALGCVTLLAIVVFLGMCGQCLDRSPDPSTSTTQPASTILPVIESFLSAHPEYGRPSWFENADRWAKGPRQSVATDEGTFLFYLLDGEVVTVYETTGGTRVERFNTYEAESGRPAPVEREETAQLPAYTIIDRVNLAVGGRHGDVLVISFSKSTPTAERERVLRSIAAKEGFTQADLYCSREAFEANMSASYARSHPGALDRCFLGRLEKGSFRGP